MRGLTKLIAGLRNSFAQARQATLRHSARLRLEELETRELPSVSPLLAPVNLPTGGIVTQIAPAGPTDMTQLALQEQSQGLIKAPTGPTYLYLNFDGYTNSPYVLDAKGNPTTVSAFTGSEQDKTDILYRTAETFAPFNVIVEQITGDGTVSTKTGATTVFVGNAGNFTPGGSMDYSSTSNTTHPLNSNAYDVAFVNPNAGSLSTSPVFSVEIVNAIAHEAGHTFGLAHVRTDGGTDFPNNNTLATYSPYDAPDVMSYNSNNDYFNNSSFNLTEANGGGINSGLFPQYNSTKLITQDSFTYLQTVLGARPSTSSVNAIDENVLVYEPSVGYRTLDLVDPGYYSGNANVRSHGTISSMGTINGTLPREGDYVAYKLDLVNNGWTAGTPLAIAPTGGTSVSLLVYDETTGTIDAGVRVTGSRYSTPLAFTPQAGHTYFLVVGGEAGSSGAFSLTAAPLTTNLAGSTITLRNAQGTVTGTVTFDSATGQIGTRLSGLFKPTDSEAPLAVTGYVAGTLNGSAAITFAGAVSTHTVIGPVQERTTIDTNRHINFSGQVTQSATAFNLTGLGGYLSTKLTTISGSATQPRQTQQTLANVTFVSGSAPKTTTTPPIVIIGPTAPVATTMGNATANVAPGNGADANMPQGTNGVKNQQAIAMLPTQGDVGTDGLEDFINELTLQTAKIKNKAQRIS
jgi:hypothetical protein